MDIIPVKKYKEPKYPTKKMVLNNSELLEALPDRWKSNAYVGIAFSALLMVTLSACETKDINQPNTNMQSKEAKIAPVFEHGKGRGSFGRSSVAPPSFLSEEEAFQVIQEEASKYDIDFKKEALLLSKVPIPETKLYLKSETYNEDGGTINSTKTGSLKLDGFDEEKKIAFEFVSRDDYEEWKVNQGVGSSVDDYDFLSTAKLLQKGLKNKNHDTSIGIFYNPMEMLSEEQRKELTDTNNWQAAEVKVKEIAGEQLRMQVKDFLEWLKAQGIM
jgi:hypothetical protein